MQKKRIWTPEDAARCGALVRELSHWPKGRGGGWFIREFRIARRVTLGVRSYRRVHSLHGAATAVGDAERPHVEAAEDGLVCGRQGCGDGGGQRALEG